MSPDFDPNRLQGQYILSRGWLRSAPVSFAYHLLEQKPGCDLCDILYVNRMITENQAQEARRAASSVIGARGADAEDGVESTQHSGPVASYLGRQASSPQRSARSELTSSLRSLRRDLVAGSRIERYEIIEEIARGGMGAVYRVRDTRDGRQVALKVLLAPEKADQVARFEREIATLSRLQHPSVAKLYDSGQVGDLAYYTMELVDGPSLAQLIGEAEPGQLELSLPWPRVVAWMREVALALAHCHDKGVIHRDIKPHNIVIDAETDRPVLIDFGLLKRDYRLAGESVSSNGLTKTGEMLGSPAYMSPEQFVLGEEKRVIGPPSDVWSFGVTLYYALTGLLPFPSRDMLALCLEVTKKPVPRLREVKPDAPEWLELLVSDCLRRSPYERPPMAELARRLGAENRKVSRRMPWAAAGLCAVGLLALAASGALLTAFREPPRVLSAAAEANLVRAERAEIRGQVSAPGVLVRLSEKVGEKRELAATVRTDDEGRFRVKVSISSQGEHDFLVIPDGSEESFLVRVTRDSLGPRLRYPAMAREGGVLIVGEDLRIRGVVEDEAFDRLLAEGEVAAVDDRGAFSLEVAPSERVQTLVLEAFDRLGNRSREELRYKTSAPLAPPAPPEPESEPAPDEPLAEPLVALPEDWQSDHEASTYHAQALAWLLGQLSKKTVTAAKSAAPELADPARACLASVDSWRAAAPAQRAAAVAAVDAGLGPAFERREGRDASELGLAAFAHRATGIEMLLIPGGDVSVPLVGVEGSAVLAILEDEDQGPEACALLLELIKVSSLRALRYLEIPGLVGLAQSASALEIADALSRRPSAFPKVRAQLTRIYQSAFTRIRARDFQVAPLLVSRFELSAGEWTRLSGRVGPQAEDAPQVGLSTEDIDAVLGRGRDGLRLPRRAEWYHACLGGLSQADVPRGAESCVARGTAAAPLPRGLPPRRANAFGLVDMLGNVEELCQPTWIQQRAQGPKALWPAAVGGRFRDLRAFIGPSSYRFTPRNKASASRGLRLVVDLP